MLIAYDLEERRREEDGGGRGCQLYGLVSWFDRVELTRFDHSLGHAGPPASLRLF
jgi:hypothetical protein